MTTNFESYFQKANYLVRSTISVCVDLTVFVYKEGAFTYFSALKKTGFLESMLLLNSGLDDVQIF